MSTATIQYFTDKFNDHVLHEGPLAAFTQQAMADFKQRGIPAIKSEEWKYTKVSTLFRNSLDLRLSAEGLSLSDLEAYRLPGAEQATEIVFVNGVYAPSLSSIRHKASDLTVLSLAEAAAGDQSDLIQTHLGHSAAYHPDGIHALNAAFSGTGVFIQAHAGRHIDGPVYIYHIADSRQGFVFAQPRSLIHVGAASQVSFVEQYVTLGGQESFTNEVFELVAEQDAVVDYYKIQNEGDKANHVGTTHIRQIGKCLTNAVTITLSGAMVRNNLNMIMESSHGESHLYGLYLLKGNTHADNHTIVDNRMPHCLSNELYKGIMDESSTGVFNGKIFVRKDAQKTNAYQSNKNILIGDSSSANTKPQLEIFADDVKCSHGCTIGRLDEEALFYLRARGISEKQAKSLLLHAFAMDILDKVKPVSLRQHIDTLISERLGFNF